MEAWTGLLAQLREASSTEVSVFEPMLPTPLVHVDLDRLDRNLEEMAERAANAGVRLRPHLKTHKIAAIADRQLALGAGGLTVATPSEAEALFAAGVAAEYLIALPFWPTEGGGRGVDGEAIAAILSVDSLELARRLSRRGVERGHVYRIAIVVDTGYRRFGVGLEDAIELAMRCTDLPFLEVCGIHSHAGEAYGLRDAGDRRRLSRAEVETMNAIAGGLSERGLEPELVSVGSTPAAVQLLEQVGLGAVNEVRPGNYAFLDCQQVALGVAPLDRCALRVVATVVASHADRVVLDAGRMTLSSSVGPDGYGAILGHPEARVEALSQESAVVTGMRGAAVGDRVEIVPVHACEVTTLAPLVHYGRRGQVQGAWPVDARACVW
ncbi:MAG: alanine racemase [Actinobacteria bacterium]|nr:alanine racemase [Actinomycetota bacterium]